MRRTACPGMDSGSATMCHMPQQTTLGADFARAFCDRDPARARELLHPDIDFRGLTPNRFWDASCPDHVVEVLFHSWLEEEERRERIAGCERDTVAGRG